MTCSGRQFIDIFIFPSDSLLVSDSSLVSGHYLYTCPSNQLGWFWLCWPVNGPVDCKDSSVRLVYFLVGWRLIVLFSVLFVTGLHMVGRRSVSSRVFRLLALFSISTTTLIKLLVLCSKLVMTSRLSKLMIWYVAPVIFMNLLYSIRFFPHIDSPFSLIDVSLTLVHRISWTPWFTCLIFVFSPVKMLLIILWTVNVVLFPQWYFYLIGPLVFVIVWLGYSRPWWFSFHRCD